MITTHILDVSKGKPASGVTVTLDYFANKKAWREVGGGVTDADGRLTNLLAADADIQSGMYRLTFYTAVYFNSQNIESFYPHVSITFIVNDREQHYHVPLLLSPFGFSTYRGS